jgi:hypothetical protein
VSPLAHKEQLALSSFIHHFAGEQAALLAEHLPEGQSLQEAPPAGAPFRGLAEPLSNTFAQIHYTWLLEPLNKFSPEVRELLLAALPAEYAARLSELLEMAFSNQPLPAPVATFFLQLLARQMHFGAVAPAEILPVSPCRPLLDLSKRRLVRLIGMLGLHDLAASLRHTIDSRPSRRIMAFLQPQQEEYLKWAMRQPDPIKNKPLELSEWGRDENMLMQQCQLQGLRRLGYAIAYEERSLIWHLSRRLDTGRGRLLLSSVSDAPSRNVSRRLVSQLSGLLIGGTE